jgi:L-ascorbate metabolism protein UlaG (beta-lactamase superfamily)
MNLRLIRHATLWLQYAGVNFLIDPMFADAEVNPPISNSTNPRRNPLVPMLIAVDDLLSPDAVLVTHLHRDHWDEAAVSALSKLVPIICQPGDASAIQADNFSSVSVVTQTLTFRGVTMIRTLGQHGTGEIGQKMGPVSGFVLKAAGQPTIYIAGDTIWCEDVKQALDMYRPDVTVVNAGGARFAAGEPITMDSDDVVSLCRYAAYTKVIAVHMEAINHCLVTRDDLYDRLSADGLLDQVSIPKDGEWV